MIIDKNFTDIKRKYGFNIRSKLAQIISNNNQGNNKHIEIKKGIKGQGVSIILDGLKIAIDHWDSKADVLFISHAHMDHIPIISHRKFEQATSSMQVIDFPKVICSKITKEIMDYRTNGKFRFEDQVWLNRDHTDYPISIEYNGITFTVLENGHTFGSNSLFIEGSKTIFYTSEFVSEPRVFPNKTFINKLKPYLCDYLVIDATFGEAFYKFPSFNEILRSTQKTINQYFEMNNPVILLGYSYGKSQLLLGMLNDDYPIYLSKDISSIVNILENNEIRFPNHETYERKFQKKLNGSSNFIFIASPGELFRNPISNLIKSGAKTLIFSGRVYLDSFQKKYKVDNYIPLSDHSDFESTIKFIEKCDPQHIFLESGRVEIFSYALMKRFHPHRSINVII